MKIENTVLQNVVRKVSSGVLCRLLTLLAVCFAIYDPNQIRIYYGQICLKIGITPKLLVTTPCLEYTELVQRFKC
jgi:hypothetical protein